MSTLVLVRHAQASFMQKEYDRLSERGVEQARRLGEWWARTGLRIDEIWVGPRRRQIDTCRLAGEAFVAAGGAGWPEPRALAALDEYQAEEVMKRTVPALGLADEQIRALALAFSGAVEPRERGRAFEKLFQAVARRWASGEVDAAGVESWHAFTLRVREAVRSMTDDPMPGARSGRRVLAFTSAGAIGVALGAAFPGGLDHLASLELGWVVRNASLTEILFTTGRLTLSSFNGVPHLHDPELWTYR